MRLKTFLSIIAVALVTFMMTGLARADDDNIMASGEFLVGEIFSFIPKEIGNKCLIEVSGELIFTGSLEGVATGTTRALVFGTCNAPPGTFRDVFRSKLVFEGNVDNIPVIADMTYQGKTDAGGEIEAILLLNNGVKGILKVDAFVLVGGSYAGFVEVDDD